MEQASPHHLSNTGTRWSRAAVRVLPKRNEVAMNHYDEYPGATAHPVKDSFKNVFLFHPWNIVPSESTDERVTLDMTHLCSKMYLPFPSEHNVRLSELIREPGHFWSTLIQTSMQSNLWMAWLQKSQATGSLCSVLQESSESSGATKICSYKKKTSGAWGCKPKQGTLNLFLNQLTNTKSGSCLPRAWWCFTMEIRSDPHSSS